MDTKMRLDRFLAECGCGTRSEVKKYIKKGAAAVNGVVAKDGSTKVDTATDLVTFNGKTLQYERYRYFLLNKPAGCVSATRDGISKTVLEFLDGEITDGLFPVGRLDKDTEGLLLITNDGDLGHRLLSPKKHVDKTYYAVASTLLTAESMQAFEAGLDIGDDKPTLPARICYIGESDALGAAAALPIYSVTIHEGRYHQVKRMFEAVGSSVVHLRRISMGPLTLGDDLAPGEYRRLTDEELAALQNA